MSFFTFFTFWKMEVLEGGEEVLLFKKEWNLKNKKWTLVFDNKKRKFLL